MLPVRKQIHLPEYDYSQNGAYFVTICSHNRAQLFSRITSCVSVHPVGAGPRPARMELTPVGEIIRSVWDDLPNHNQNLSLGEFVIMPDHIHGILLLDGRAGLGPAPTALPEIIRQLKSFSSRRCHEQQLTPPGPLWQRGYYEHILRNSQDLDDAVAYIQGNPARWLERADTERRAL